MKNGEYLRPVQDGPPSVVPSRTWIHDALGRCIVAIVRFDDIEDGPARYLVQHIALGKRKELLGLLNKTGEVSVLAGGVIDDTVDNLYDRGEKLRSVKEVKRRYRDRN